MQNSDGESGNVAGSPLLMKVSFPLSLKILLWLLLNVVLLAAIAAGILVIQAGVGWNAIVRGPAGDRIQELGQMVAGEMWTAPESKHDALLAKFSERYAAEFIIFRNDGLQLVGSPLILPDSIVGHLRGDRLSVHAGMRPPSRGENRPPSGKGLHDPPRREDGIPMRMPGPEAAARGRFMERTSQPNGYWFGTRIPYTINGRPEPATVIIRVDSLWGLSRLLNVQPWLFALISIFPISILFWLPLVHGITRDLRRLSRATERIADGHFDTRVNTARGDEIGHLGDSVNSMAKRLETLVDGQKRFLGDVAHELGSPLGRLQVAMEILKARAGSDLRGQIDDVREEVQQMTSLVGELLAFTRAGMKSPEGQLKEVAVAPMVADVLSREDAEGCVSADIIPSLQVRADERLLKRAVGNLVRNAIRYAGGRGPIRLAVTREDGRVRIAVEDSGPGVPAEALERLGEPFYRPEEARSRETGGVGLGLAIVRSAVAACGGEVTFSNRPEGGFRAEIWLGVA